MTSHSVAAAAEDDPWAGLNMSDELGRGIIKLSRRWASAGVKGKGITLAGHELDLLNAVGIGRLVMSAAAEEQMDQAIERQALRARAALKAPLALGKRSAVAVPEKLDCDTYSSLMIGEDTVGRVGTSNLPAPPAPLAEQRRDNLLRISEVRRRTGLSRATVYRRVDLKTFPPKVQLGPGSVAWYQSDIDAFVADPSGYRAV